MGLQQMKKEQIPFSLSFAVAHGHVGNGNPANPLIQMNGRTIPGEVEEISRFREPREFVALELCLQLAQDHGPYIVHVYPGAENGERNRFVQFGQGTVQLKGSDFHVWSLLRHC